MVSNYSHVVGFDDAPFSPTVGVDVPVIGAVFAGLRLEGILHGNVQRDGTDSTDVLIHLVHDSRFGPQLQLILLQGITVAGFNVIDLPRLSGSSGMPVIAIARRMPDYEAIRRALLNHVPGGLQKWQMIEAIGPMEPVGGIYVQRVGISLDDTASIVRQLAVHGRLPEPIRTAHLVASGLWGGHSRQRA